MTAKRFTLVNDYLIEYDGSYFDLHKPSNIRSLVTVIGYVTDENEQLKKDRFICLDCEHSGYAEIGCLCEYNDCWQDHITECEYFKELKMNDWKTIYYS